jgi:hypothetical protein
MPEKKLPHRLERKKDGMDRSLLKTCVFAAALTLGAILGSEALAAPPAHAPAHGYRAKHQYRYYPACSAYYDTGRKLWFYIKAGDWTFGASLPADLRARLGGSVMIDLDTDRPYDFHGEHAEKYPAQKYKPKKK